MKLASRPAERPCNIAEGTVMAVFCHKPQYCANHINMIRLNGINDMIKIWLK